MSTFEERLLEVLSGIEDGISEQNKLLETQNALIYEDLCRKYPQQDQQQLSTSVGSNPQLAEILRRQKEKS